jgi:hypothetical protein
MVGKKAGYVVALIEKFVNWKVAGALLVEQTSTP